MLACGLRFALQEEEAHELLGVELPFYFGVSVLWF